MLRCREGIGHEGTAGNQGFKPLQQGQRIAHQDVARDHAAIEGHPQLGLAFFHGQKQSQ